MSSSAANSPIVAEAAHLHDPFLQAVLAQLADAIQVAVLTADRREPQDTTALREALRRATDALARLRHDPH
ncbi:MAG: hypothetical protein HY701_14105 [Gemmatimonadetes bacterium]|nr:hypothetical protein [Gemmatimonadota bacterium]